jgi:hypothetical protein
MVSPAEVAVVRKQVGHDFVMKEADKLCKADPTLTREQAYAKAFVAPENKVIALAALGKGADTTPFITTAEAGRRYTREGSDQAAPVVDPAIKLASRADELRSANPGMTRSAALGLALKQDSALRASIGLITNGSKGRATENPVGTVDSSRT